MSGDEDLQDGDRLAEFTQFRQRMNERISARRTRSRVTAFPSPSGRRWRAATDEGMAIPTHGKHISI